jgi:hypothetical protein
MSLASAESVFCLECEERHHFPSEMLLYRPPGKAGPPEYRDWDWGVMLTDHAWCFQCEGPAYLERVPSKQELKIACAFRAQSGVPRPAQSRRSTQTLGAVVNHAIT